MSALAAAGLTAGTFVKVVLGALVAGLGVTVAFSSLIYCADRAMGSQREEQKGAALLFSLGGVLALLVCLALVAGGLVLVASKSK